MKLTIAFVAFLAAFVHQIVAQQLADPKPQQPSQPQKAPGQHSLLARRQHMLRLRGELQLYKKMKHLLNPTGIRTLIRKLGEPGTRALVRRMMYLRRLQKQGKLPQDQSPTPGGQNMVLSGASRVRQTSTKNANAAASIPSIRGRNQLARRPTTPRRRPSAGRYLNPIMAIQRMSSNRKKQRHALAAGCSRPPVPIEDPFFRLMVNSAGCKSVGMLCASEMKTCIEYGKTPMCCPVGITGRAISLFNQMRQMQRIFSQLQ